MGFWLDHSYVAGGNLKGCSLGMPIGGSKMVEETAVWLHNLLRKKTTMPWQGPYIVTKRINEWLLAPNKATAKFVRLGGPPCFAM